MKKPLFQRCLELATLGVAALAFTACGGGADGDQAVNAEPQVRALALEPPAAPADDTTQGLFEQVAADAGAAAQEPK